MWCSNASWGARVELETVQCDQNVENSELPGAEHWGTIHRFADVSICFQRNSWCPSLGLLTFYYWRAYILPNTHLFGCHKGVKITSKEKAWLKDLLALHALAYPFSTETKIISSIAVLCSSVGPLGKPKNITMASRGTKATITLMRHAMPILWNPNNTQNDTPLTSCMKTNLNHFLPFCEHAPSCLLITRPEGPFHMPYNKTHSGIFGALIFCDITFSEPALLDVHNKGFKDIKDWLSYCPPHLEKTHDKHFMDIEAYSAPNPDHHPNAAYSYWSRSKGWEQFIKQDVTFNKTFNYLLWNHGLWAHVCM
jgi:hypothetical protein